MSEARMIKGLKMALEASDAETQDRYTQAMRKRASEIIARSEDGGLVDVSPEQRREQAKAIRARTPVDRSALRDFVTVKLRIFNPDFLTEQ